jgi:hypothetical protein
MVSPDLGIWDLDLINLASSGWKTTVHGSRRTTQAGKRQVVEGSKKKKGYGQLILSFFGTPDELRYIFKIRSKIPLTREQDSNEPEMHKAGALDFKISAYRSVVYVRS